MADAAGTPEQPGIGLDDAANAFSQLLDRDPGTERLRKAAPTVETTADEADEETPEEAEEPEADADAEATDDADEEPDEGEAEAPKVYTVKIDGKEIQVPEDELVKGYQRQSDYTRKTQELAETRKAFQADYQAVKEERAQYGALLGQFAARLEQDARQEPDWQHLIDTNVPEYLRQKERWEGLQRQRQAAQYEQQRLQQVQAVEQQKQLQDQLEKGSQHLLENIPEWRKPEVASAERQKIRQYAVEAGYSTDEIDGVTDPRAVIMLRKAMMYDQLAKSPRPLPVKANSPRPLQPGSTVSQPKAVSSLSKAKQRLGQTGRLEDAASVFAKLL